MQTSVGPGAAKPTIEKVSTGMQQASSTNLLSIYDFICQRTFFFRNQVSKYRRRSGALSLLTTLRHSAFLVGERNVRYASKPIKSWTLEFFLEMTSASNLPLTREI